MTGPSLHELPPDLPAPLDDGAADHLPGRSIPTVRLPATTGAEIDLKDAARRTAVIYVYPRTGVPGEPLPAGWDEIPGARGCTLENCAFRDSSGRLAALGARVLGLSTQEVGEQREFALREAIRHPLVSDPLLLLADALGLPTFEAGGLRFYRRLTLVAVGGRIEKVFYPVFPPDRHAGEVVAWLSCQPEGRSQPLARR